MPLKKLKKHQFRAFFVVIWTLLLGVLLAGLAINMRADSVELGPPPLMPENPGFAVEKHPDVSSDVEPMAYLPLVLKPEEQMPWVNTQKRQEVVDYYQVDYQASEGVAIGWTGDRNSCNPGVTSAAFKEAIVRRINYFREMAGVPSIIGLRADYNNKAQQAALMMSVNQSLSHNPPESWSCYTEDGDEAAGSSNLYLGRYGPSAISGYVYDPGSGNSAVGHRRWILYPQTRYMGSGDIPSSGGWSSNSLWVFDRDNMWGPRPDTRDAFVAWPPAGYVPYQVVFPRWSFSYAGANFSSATVSMTQNGSPVSVDVQPVQNGYGENTLVWESNLSISAPTSDVVFHISVQQVEIGGGFQNFEYDVIMINPG